MKSAFFPLSSPVRKAKITKWTTFKWSMLTWNIWHYNALSSSLSVLLIKSKNDCNVTSGFTSLIVMWLWICSALFPPSLTVLFQEFNEVSCGFKWPQSPLRLSPYSFSSCTCLNTTQNDLIKGELAWRTYVAGQRLCLSPSLSSQWNYYANSCPSWRAGDCQRLHLHADKASQLYPIARTNQSHFANQFKLKSGFDSDFLDRGANRTKPFSARGRKQSIGGDESQTHYNSFKTENLFAATSLLKISVLPGQFTGSYFLIVPVTRWLVLQNFTLDKGICLYAKGLCCPDRGGEALVSFLSTWQCRQSVISAINRPEQPSPVAPPEEAEDFRATDSGVRSQVYLHAVLSPLETNWLYSPVHTLIWNWTFDSSMV